jgi:lipopolysaccharide transport system ATP-binding protein
MNVIAVENLSKLYYLGERRASSLRDAITGFFKRPAGERHTTDLWALRDLSFTVRDGETLGIIGRNGAGKSTLLKILSRITKPTKGMAEIRGRIGSLLEVGTGFHNELTGRENIYLNGAILGMRRPEIRRKFDEIVAFSEIEKFLDTPVKYYSSGMYMRLAFAVAAHLEPDILIVDEVLAVGDVEFQKKCLGKMDEVTKAGRTVIFVSHQLGSIAQLCQRSILLDNGSLVMEGPSQSVIEHYLNHGKQKSASYLAEAVAAHSEIYVRSSVIADGEGLERDTFRHDEPVLIKVECGVNQRIRGTELRMVVKDVRGMVVFTTDADLGSLSDKTESFAAEFRIPANFLRPNSYSVSLALFIPHQHVFESLDDVSFFSVFDGGTKYAHSEGAADYGLVFSPCEVSIKRID